VLALRSKIAVLGTKQQMQRMAQKAETMRNPQKTRHTGRCSHHLRPRRPPVASRVSVLQTFFSPISSADLLKYGGVHTLDSQ
jgi:hypothetical protein